LITSRVREVASSSTPKTVVHEVNKSVIGVVIN
jgi:hypothetical protein